jgi:hydroxymethylbilane synthase
VKRKIIIGTRGSELALWQAEHVKNLLKDIGITAELKIIKTQGDKIQNLSFDKLEGKGFFTKEIEDALLAGETDLAVHSHKDLPTTNPKGLIIAAVSDREDPSELIIIRKEAHDSSLKFEFKTNAVVGTSSARRKCQLLSFREDIQIKDIRGNVPTRIDKLRKGEFDAILLASAGIERLKLDLSDLITVKPSKREFVPAPAQGVLALQIREEDKELAEKLKALNNEHVQECIGVERKILNLFDGGCQLPLGAWCYKEGDTYKVYAAKADGWNVAPKRIYLEALSSKGLAKEVTEMIRKANPCIVFITREISSESFLYRALEANRYRVFGQSLIDIKILDFDSIPETDWIFFSSRNAVTAFFTKNLTISSHTKFAAVGSGTEAALKALGKKVSFVGSFAETDKTGKEFSDFAGKKTVLFPKAKDSLRSIQKQFAYSQGVHELDVYQTHLKEKISVPVSDVVIFTSPSNVEAYFKNADLSKVQRVICMGKSTAEKLKSYGITDPVIPDYPDETGLTQAVFGLRI